MNIKRGDIYWIKPNPYRPTAGNVQQSNRPGIIVSNNENNRHAHIAEIVYLTTAPKNNLPTHCTVKGTSNTDSTAICEQITTVSIDEQIGGYIRTCTREEMTMVDRCILISLGIDGGQLAENSDTEKECEELREAICELEGTIVTMEVDRDDYLDRIATLEAELARHKAREELLRELYERAISK